MVFTPLLTTTENAKSINTEKESRYLYSVQVFWVPIKEETD